MKKSTYHITNQYWVSSSACPYQGYGQSNVYMFFAWTVVMARQVSRTIEYSILIILDMCCLMTSLLVCVHICFQVKWLLLNNAIHSQPYLHMLLSTGGIAFAGIAAFARLQRVYIITSILLASIKAPKLYCNNFFLLEIKNNNNRIFEIHIKKICKITIFCILKVKTII